MRQGSSSLGAALMPNKRSGEIAQPLFSAVEHLTAAQRGLRAVERPVSLPGHVHASMLFMRSACVLDASRFPAPMCAAVDRAIAYMAQTADRGIRFATNDNEYPNLIYEVYSQIIRVGWGGSTRLAPTPSHLKRRVAKFAPCAL